MTLRVWYEERMKKSTINLMRVYAVLSFSIFGEVDAPAPTYSWISKNIFQARCATSCHQGASPDGNVDLTSYDALLSSDGLLEKPIVAGFPEKSGVWIQVNQKTMPKSGEKLTTEEIQTIYDWIKGGAKNN